MCVGITSCSLGQQLQNVNSLYCTGEQACLNLLAELSGDLFCDGDANDTCSSPTSFGFKANDANKHCIQCISNDYGGICKTVLFDFTALPADPATTVRMKCEGSDACGSSLILLPAGVTLYIHCDGPNTCIGLQVISLGGTCFFLSSGNSVAGRLKGFAVLVNVIVPCY